VVNGIIPLMVNVKITDDSAGKLTLWVKQRAVKDPPGIG
jgi:hypothetical protein